MTEATHDMFCGVGAAPNLGKQTKPDKFLGENQLGKVLHRIRNFILKREYAFNTHSSFNILLGYNNYYVDQASCFLVCVKLLKYNHGVVKMVCGNTQCMKWRSFIHLFKYSSYVHRSWYVYNSTRLYYCIFYYINLIRLYYSWLRRDRYHACANIVQSHYFKKGCLFYIVYAMVLSNYIKYG